MLSGLPKYGVNHADELYLMWDPLYDQHRALNPADTEMSDILLSAWASFIKSGVPQVTSDYIVYRCLPTPPMSG